MTTTINADTVVGGAVVTADASGQLGLQAAGVTKLTVSSSGVTLASALPVGSGGTGITTTPTAGAVPYGNGSTLAFTAAGTSGQVLTSAGSSAPTWATPATGALVFISSQTVSTAVASVDFTSGFSSTYDDYLILLENVAVAVADRFAIRFYKTSALVTSATYAYGLVCSAGTGAAANPETGNAQITPFTTNNATNATMCGLINLYQVNTSTKSGFSMTLGASSATTASCLSAAGAGTNTAAGSVTGISFYLASASNISSGTFRLYGIAKA